MVDALVASPGGYGRAKVQSVLRAAAARSRRALDGAGHRKYMEITGVTVDEIDIHFGWNERVLLKAMQIHYASMSIRERMKHAKITGML